MRMLIITNNPKVRDALSERAEVVLMEGQGQDRVLIAARDRIHLGACLITHPMTGRIRPNETPYKSVLLAAGEGKPDMSSMTIIEDSIAETQKYLQNTLRKEFDAGSLEDLREIDLMFVKGGMDEYGRSL